jgi:carboxylate-amine ligase
LKSFETLLHRLQRQLQEENLAPLALSHHPTEVKFEGPQNRRRHDFWLWAMEVMTTYGPDINIRLPETIRQGLDLKDLDGKLNFYSPCLAALTVASPFVSGGLWKIRGVSGQSFRMYKRSIFAPPIEIHPDQDWRLEFKAFDMPSSTLDFRCQFLCFLGLLLTPELKGRASKQSLIYDMGQVAQFGLSATTVHDRLGEFFAKVPSRLSEWGFDPSPLEHFERRWKDRSTPADELIQLFDGNGGDLSSVLNQRAHFEFDRALASQQVL